MSPLRPRRRGRGRGPARSVGEERGEVGGRDITDAWMEIDRLAGNDPMTHLSWPLPPLPGRRGT